MKKTFFCVALSVATALGGLLASGVRAEDVQIDGKSYRKISVAEYRDKMKGGWIGQIAGVCWGAPTEFRYCNRIIPEDELPVWKPEMINDAFGQDDIYVEMTFLRTMEETKKYDPNYGVSNQETIRKAWKSMTGQDVTD